MQTPIDRRPRYNLNVVVRETGVKADTLRAWERRYGLPLPQRSPGGHRLYSQYDVETVKWLLAKRSEKGMSISKAVDLWRSIEDSEQDPLDLSVNLGISGNLLLNETNELTAMRSAWIDACLAFDETRSGQILNQSFALYPIETVFSEILQKGLATIGDYWYQGKASVQQEHFAAELANRRLHALIASAPHPKNRSKILMACPPKELHTFPALLLTALLRNRGWDVTNLGADVPLIQLRMTLEQIKPDLVVSVAMRLETAATLKNVATLLKNKRITLAFGGRIFINLPKLTNRIHGNFLGQDIFASIPKIESLLMDASSQHDLVESPIEYSEAITDFIDAQPIINAEVMHWARSQTKKKHFLDTIHQANEGLGIDIVAALDLGNIDYIKPNLTWLLNLLSHRGMPIDLLLNYLMTYQNTAEATLNTRGQEIVRSLSGFIKEIKQDGV